MNCRDVEPLLADLLGGELDEPGRRAVEDHLATCDACRREADELRTAVHLMRSLDTVSDAEANENVRALEVVRRRPPALRLAFAGLRAAAFIALGAWIGWTTAAGRPSVPTPYHEPALALQHVEEAGALVHPNWRDRALESAPGRSSFARQLALIAHRRDR